MNHLKIGTESSIPNVDKIPEEPSPKLNCGGSLKSRTKQAAVRKASRGGLNVAAKRQISPSSGNHTAIILVLQPVAELLDVSHLVTKWH